MKDYIEDELDEDCEHDDIEDGFCLICGEDCSDELMVEADYLYDMMKDSED
jgi:hypothetical protein